MLGNWWVDLDVGLLERLTYTNNEGCHSLRSLIYFMPDVQRMTIFSNGMPRQMSNIAMGSAKILGYIYIYIYIGLRNGCNILITWIFQIYLFSIAIFIMGVSETHE